MRAHFRPLGLVAALLLSATLPHARDAGGAARSQALGASVVRGGGAVSERPGQPSAPTWSQQAALAPPPNIGTFGSAVAVQGTTAVVDAYNQDFLGLTDVYTRSGGTWSQQATLTPTVPQGGFYKYTVALSGDTVLAGYSNDLVNVYVRRGTRWGQQATLVDPGRVGMDGFGEAVALSGTGTLSGSGMTALIGVPGYSGPAGSGQGAADVYTRSGNTWTLQATLTAPDGLLGDAFGNAVALSGQTAVVGAPTREGNRGAVYIFVGSGSHWSLQAEINDPLAQYPNAFFGQALSLEGNTLVVGAPGAYGAVGHAYIYARSGSTWAQQAALSSGIIYYGLQVALSGDTALVSSGNEALVYVYMRSGGVWTQQATLVDPGMSGNDQFGSGLSFSWNTALVGAMGADNTGVAYVFVRSGTAWAASDTASLVKPRRHLPAQAP